MELPAGGERAREVGISDLGGGTLPSPLVEKEVSWLVHPVSG
jgi:hypothetical protein